MSRLALLNMAFGFLIIAIAASAGAFVGNSLSEAYLNQIPTDTFLLTLQKSAHGHTNLFGMLHILYGLTFPYSRLSQKFKVFQTLGLAAGTFAMGPVMLVRILMEESAELNLITYFMGLLLSLALASLITHSFGLFVRR